ncbi:NUDIX hydrolase [Leptolyngbya sp. FACHB-711]|uniref:NUDIX hydrolase n=1 Tax=unclassified Leptolyngbya TaxID=2650499 RepID=UPI001683B88E|nr:NUDIX hydrolase [Leptolyngbya sp. FACHB-711]MBD1849240.1 NUDIX hydrolase [Cyanobacteria bacterium FACHB-502]MBD2023599.1 NUDIX hydrolase [Leptolyngbya sp. FACHB-711]
MQQLQRYLQTALGLVFRHPITGTSIVPILPDGRIVLIQRRDNGKWSLPGGIVDWGEDIPSAVRRELAEETGLSLVEIKRLVGVYSSPERDSRFHSICVLVEAMVDGTMQIQDSLEVMAIRAFLPTDIPQGDLSHDHDRQIEDYFRGATILA